MTNSICLCTLSKFQAIFSSSKISLEEKNRIIDGTVTFLDWGGFTFMTERCSQSHLVNSFFHNKIIIFLYSKFDNEEDNTDSQNVNDKYIVILQKTFEILGVYYTQTSFFSCDKAVFVVSFSYLSKFDPILHAFDIANNFIY